MARQKLYRYNAETDNFERVFPSLRQKLGEALRTGILALAFGAVLCVGVLYWWGTPAEKELRRQNEVLESQYSFLNKRLDNLLGVLQDIQNRDDNFYRVMLQMEPLPRSQRYAGLDNDRRYQKLAGISDGALITLLSQKTDLLERQLYAQSVSFNQLRDNVGRRGEKLLRIPAILPVDEKKTTLSAGFGLRRDPVEGVAKFHPGIDFAAPPGTAVWATADGRVAEVGRNGSDGLLVRLDHGDSYTTLYSHLSETLVQPGQRVRRGQTIAKVGNTGRSTAPHLHYEVIFKGNPENPVKYFFKGITPSHYSELMRQADNAGKVLD